MDWRELKHNIPNKELPNGDISNSLWFPIEELENTKKEHPFFTPETIIQVRKDYEYLWKNGGLFMMIINLKKGCGKTVWIINQTNSRIPKLVRQWKHNRYLDKDDPNREIVEDKFLMLFRSDEIKKVRAQDIKDDNEYEWMIIGNRIVTKGKVIEYQNKNGEIEQRYDENYPKGVHIGSAYSIKDANKFSGAQFREYNACYYDEYRSKTALTPSRT